MLPQDASDRGPSFLSKLVGAVQSKLNIQHSATTAYHPQTDGLTERCNKTLVDMLSKYISEQQNDWDEFYLLWCLLTTQANMLVPILHLTFWYMAEKQSYQLTKLFHLWQLQPQVLSVMLIEC